MFTESFKNFIESSIKHTSAKLSDQNKLKLYKTNRKLFESIDFNNDEAFLEPLLFGYFSNPDASSEITLEQILFSYLKEKPSTLNFSGFSNRDGFIYVPRLGYLDAKTPEAQTQICYDNATKAFSSLATNANLPFSPIRTIDQIEVCQQELPLVFNHFEDHTKYNYKVKETFDHSIEKIQKALSMLQEHNSFFYKCLKEVLSKIIVYFDNQALWSNATLRFPGTIFVSTNPSRSEIFYQEDIIHQTAHLIFFHATYFDKEDLLKVAPHDLFAKYTGNEQDNRTVYSAYHGLFTQANINSYFDLCLEHNLYHELFEYEIFGRLSDNMKRWKKVLADFNQVKVFTPNGLAIFQELENVYKILYKKYSDLINKFDTSNQPYIFDFAAFTQKNPYT